MVANMIAFLLLQPFELSGGVYTNRAAGITATVPQGFTGKVESSGDLAIGRAGDEAGGLFHLSPRRGDESGLDDLAAEFQKRAASSPFFRLAGVRLVQERQQQRSFPLGAAKETLWKFGRGGQSWGHAAFVLVDTCGGKAIALFYLSWTTDDGQHALESWLSSFRQVGACDPIPPIPDWLKAKRQTSASPRPRVSASYVEIRHGSLDEQVLRERVHKNFSDEIADCYNRTQPQSSHIEQTKMDLLIDGDGSVAIAKIVESNTKDPKGDRCVERAAHRWHFPNPRKGSKVDASLALHLLW
jgi:hypothetical protein